MIETKLRELVCKVAREAGHYILENLGKVHSIRFKSNTINLVTEVDHGSEAMIVKALSQATPGYGFLGEEMGEKGPAGGFRWIIDPLDGTTNFAHGFPFFCVSIALEKEAKPVFGVVYDPVRDELFTAAEGEGALLNGAGIKVSTTEKTGAGLLTTGFSYQVKVSGQNLKHFENFIMAAQAVRRAGSAALDLCYLACGRFDGFWEMDLQPWDTAAASLIVEEAGGQVTDFKGGPYSHYLKEVVASNGRIHAEMLKVLAQGESASP